MNKVYIQTADGSVNLPIYDMAEMRQNYLRIQVTDGTKCFRMNDESRWWRSAELEQHDGVKAIEIYDDVLYAICGNGELYAHDGSRNDEFYPTGTDIWELVGETDTDAGGMAVFDGRLWIITDTSVWEYDGSLLSESMTSNNDHIGQPTVTENMLYVSSNEGPIHRYDGTSWINPITHCILDGDENEIKSSGRAYRGSVMFKSSPYIRVILGLHFYTMMNLDNREGIHPTLELDDYTVYDGDLYGTDGHDPSWVVRLEPDGTRESSSDYFAQNNLEGIGVYNGDLYVTNMSSNVLYRMTKWPDKWEHVTGTATNPRVLQVVNDTLWIISYSGYGDSVQAFDGEETFLLKDHISPTNVVEYKNRIFVGDKGSGIIYVYIPQYESSGLRLRRYNSTKYICNDTPVRPGLISP